MKLRLFRDSYKLRDFEANLSMDRDGFVNETHVPKRILVSQSNPSWKDVYIWDANRQTTMDDETCYLTYLFTGYELHA